jgi:hypothetical protein
MISLMYRFLEFRKYLCTWIDYVASSLYTLSTYKGGLYLKGNVTTCRVVEGEAKTRERGGK